MTAVLADAPWLDVPPGSLVLVPVGSTEQHGPHLPLDTDSAIADAVAHRCAESLARHRADEPVLVAPVVTYGASGEHQAFRGTCSIGTEALRMVTVELVRSIRTWAERVVLVNGHGGNVPALRAAVSQLRAEGHAVAWASCATRDTGGQGDAHAGFSETSLMLHLRPRAVRLERAEPGNTTPIERLLPRLVADGVAAVSVNGVLGDPTGASAAEGARLFAQMAADVTRSIESWQPDSTGRLRLPAGTRV
ncbi:mycofactocin biosynthesis peptidyl-dipeptidase MftE [Blastococcus sp. CT_GayMR19]|uniref:mycofactocin biosynthesis peptidyl-dipeptidase MftE n=1 Tax=Blastococcus sp. CT_GayMR19 TaxID=2559608 RepID=UPI0010743F79|nr:mycofactocin biosynthesis peptidyl-dipeptidase MftE [Blastococcus sp. CT_GayMR19]TFV70291.1 mycofactocin biosynthesis peptidyl-dipeptidase MftE [Blastococcus sp. CT_GayMR19]